MTMRRVPAIFHWIAEYLPVGVRMETTCQICKSSEHIVVDDPKYPLESSRCSKCGATSETYFEVDTDFKPRYAQPQDDAPHNPRLGRPITEIEFDSGPTALNLLPLREANAARQAEWHGGEKVDLAFRGLELAGEVGELANKLKKLVRLNRGIHGTSEDREALLKDIRDEAGDVLVCLDLVAMEIGFDLGKATREKFNKTSVKHGHKTRMAE